MFLRQIKIPPETGAIMSGYACVTVYQNMTEEISAYHLLMCKRLLCRAVLQVTGRSEEPWMDKSVPAWGTLDSQGWLEAPNPGWLSETWLSSRAENPWRVKAVTQSWRTSPAECHRPSPPVIRPCLFPVSGFHFIYCIPCGIIALNSS